VPIVLAAPTKANISLWWLSFLFKCLAAKSSKVVAGQPALNQYFYYFFVPYFFLLTMVDTY
jgi:hypothetical protein